VDTDQSLNVDAMIESINRELEQILRQISGASIVAGEVIA
jgi:hypothetical protein